MSLSPKPVGVSVCTPESGTFPVRCSSPGDGSSNDVLLCEVYICFHRSAVGHSPLYVDHTTLALRLALDDDLKSTIAERALQVPLNLRSRCSCDRG